MSPLHRRTFLKNISFVLAGLALLKSGLIRAGAFAPDALDRWGRLAGDLDPTCTSALYRPR